MPSLFAITVASNSLSLNAQRKGEAAFAVFNSSGRTVRGRAVLVPQGGAAPDWFSIAGEAEREFAPSGAAQYAVQIEIPPGAPPGEYSFRLDMVNVANPDEDYTQGQVVSFGVPESAEPFRIPWWAYAAAGVLVVVVVAVFVWPPDPDGEIEVPDVAEHSIAEAVSRLGEAGLQVSEVTESEDSSAVEEGRVIRTEPPPGTEVEEGTVITLVLSTGPEDEVPPIDDTDTPAPPELSPLEELAPIENVAMEAEATDPVQANLVLVTGLPNSCYSFGDYNISREGDTFRVEVTNVRPDDPTISCLQVFRTVTTEIPLEGEIQICQTYTAIVNDESHSVQAIAPNVRCADAEAKTVTGRLLPDGTIPLISQPLMRPRG